MENRDTPKAPSLDDEIRNFDGLQEQRDDMLLAIERINQYMYATDKQIFFEDGLRQHAVAHNMGILGHGVLGLQDFAGFQRYESLLDPWHSFCAQFAFHSVSELDWEAVREKIARDLPSFKAELVKIGKDRQH